MDFIRKNWFKFLLFIVIFIILIPLSINNAFKSDWGIEWLRAEWSAGDAIGFYGCIVAACLAIYGVYLTIDFTRESAKEDKRHSVLPFFAVSFLDITSHYSRNLFSDYDEIRSEKQTETNYYHEYELRDITFVVEKGNIQAVRQLSDSQQTVIKRNGVRDERIGEGVYATVSVDMVYLPMKLENVGNGAAISVRMGLHRKGTEQQDRKYIKPIPIERGGAVFARLYSEDCSENSLTLGEYCFEIVYSDIYGNKYAQEHDIELYYNVEKQVPGWRVNTIHDQRLIK